MVQATIDRIEGDVAVLVLDTGSPQTITVPSILIPDGCREGDIVRLTLEPDPEATRTGRERIAGTIARLTGK
jgi:hypothetical protein